MATITSIRIGSSSGYGPIDRAFSMELVVTWYSISYEYKPERETEFRKAEEWSYRTTNPTFQGLFWQAAVAAVEGINRVEKKFVTDIGSSSISVTYDDGTSIGSRLYFPEDKAELKECFEWIQQMVPGCESIPALISTSSSYRKRGGGLGSFFQTLSRLWSRE